MKYDAKQIIKENIVLIKNDEIEKFLSQEVPKELLDEVLELMNAAGYPEERLRITRDAVANKMESAIINYLLEKGIRNYVVLIRDYTLRVIQLTNAQAISVYEYSIKVHINGREYDYGPKEIMCIDSQRYETIAYDFMSNINIRLI